MNEQADGNAADLDLDEIRDQIERGMDVRQFMATPGGKLVAKRANEQIEAAVEALKNVDPEQIALVRKIQNDCLVPSLVLSWLGEIVAEGEQAEKMFHTYG